MSVEQSADYRAFLRAVCEAPDDDLPRLVLADWLDEHSCPDRAEFVRVQCELAKLPPAHVEVTERCVLERRYGPDYYTLTGGEGTEDGPVIMRVKVGDRVDVLRPTNNKGKPMYGLRVHRITDDEVILVNDAKSGPWAGQALRRRERELLHVIDPGKPCGRHWTWAPKVVVEVAFADAESYETALPFVWSRGFVSAVTLSWEDWVRHSAVLLAACPIRRVNRPRACGECNGHGYRLHGHVATWPRGRERQPCPACDGTGKVDVWRGDGLVRLTTRPEVTDFGGDSGDVRYGLTRPVLTAAELGSVFAWHRMLDDAYPGVEFELPTARGDGPRDNRAILVDAAYRAIAADTQAGPTHDSPASAFFRTSLTPEARP